MVGNDPIYPYLLNGTNLAGGHLEVGHIDHPGTTVQSYAAVVIFIQHLLSGNLPLYQDVLSNPENYMYTCSIILVLLLGLVTYYTGKYIYRNTHELMAAILFQLVPASTPVGIYNASLLMPEAFIIITATLYTAYLYINIIAGCALPSHTLTGKKIIKMAVCSSFLIATKITCLPFVLPVLFIIKKK